MLILSAALLALSAPAAPAATLDAPAQVAAVEGDHGKLPWFKGTFEELLAAAKKDNKPVFIDFWAEW